ncbi:MAG: sulfatase-like hydrolase/transferase [Verrucomicrobia bacterium]|nr:sulfatase-like hydrolase/transferase [Verrucomicrobiota bacterium]
MNMLTVLKLVPLTPDLKSKLVACFSAIFVCSAMAGVERPNILLIYTDDQRPDAFGALGNPDIQTPNMDRMIREGFVFNRAYIQGSMTPATCLPSRAMLMSGKSLFRAPLQLESGVLMPQVYQGAGYRTFATGKWHNGIDAFQRCFQEAEAVFFGGAARSHVQVPVQRMVDGLMVPYDAGDTFSTVLFADAAITFLQRPSTLKQPFFCYIPFTAPHSPVTPPGKWATMYEPSGITLPPNHAALRPELAESGTDVIARGGRGGRRGAHTSIPEAKRAYARYYGLVTHLDHHIGRVLEALEQSGLDEKTIVVLATDHGMAMGSHGKNGKHNAYEHTSRVQIIVSGAGIPKGTSDALVYLHDIYPTLCRLSGLEVPDSVEGSSLEGIIHGQEDKVRDYLFTAYMDDQRTLRDERWKLFDRPREKRVALYDLANDPHELNDVSERNENKARLRHLQSELIKAQAHYGDTPERSALLMRSRGGRPSVAGRRRPGNGSGSAMVNRSDLARRLTEKILSSTSTDASLTVSRFQEVWIQLHAGWLGNAPSDRRQGLVQGFAQLMGAEIRPPSNLGGRRRGRGRERIMGAHVLMARAFIHASDADGDRDITGAELSAAVTQWSTDVDSNGNGTCTHAEVKAWVVSLLEATPASRGGRFR